MKKTSFHDEPFTESEAGVPAASSPFPATPDDLKGLPPPSERLPNFTPFLVVAALLVGVWAYLFFTAPKDMKPQHLHVCETQGPDSHKTLCFH